MKYSVAGAKRVSITYNVEGMVDGVVAKTATSKGSYAIASCDASIGTLS